MEISVVIPTFNRANLVFKAIESVLKQTYKASEIIVIDDGSDDETKKIVENYDIKYFYQKNSGVSSARNKGIKVARYDWIAFLDSDDVWREDKLQKQVDLHIKNKDILFFHTGEKWIRDKKPVKYPKRLKKPEGKCFLDNLTTCKIAASSVLCHKKIFDKVGMFDTGFRVCEDYDMWLRISLHYKIGLIDENLITKYAGERNQLSKIIFAIDRYHIRSLIKFLNTKYRREVLNTIKLKYEILKKGALKYNNMEIMEEFNEILLK